MRVVQLETTARYRFRTRSGGALVNVSGEVFAATVTLRCLFCLAHYQATLDARIPCPACQRVEAEP